MLSQHPEEKAAHLASWACLPGMLLISGSDLWWQRVGLSKTGWDLPGAFLTAAPGRRRGGAELLLKPTVQLEGCLQGEETSNSSPGTLLHQPAAQR